MSEHKLTFDKPADTAHKKTKQTNTSNSTLNENFTNNENYINTTDTHNLLALYAKQIIHKINDLNKVQAQEVNADTW